MVRVAGERWKEASISGKVVDAEQRYIEAGLEQIGGAAPRKRAGDETSVPDVRVGHEGGTRPRVAELQEFRHAAGALDESFDPLPPTATAPVLVISDCDNLCQWTKGTWKLFKSPTAGFGQRSNSA